jgi:type I restriction-modification system, S subunit
MSKYGNAAYLEGIPDEWNCLPLKRCFRISKRIAGELGYDVLSITQRGLRVRDITDFKGQLSSDYSKYQIVEPGDFAMNHMDLLTGWIDCSEQLGVTSPDYRVFKIDRDEFDKRYFLYFFQSCYNLRIFYGFGRGVSGMGRWRLPADQFNNMMIPVPTPAIQKAIADYLDVRCSEIDKAIEAAEVSIEEYKLYKKSVIFQAVTKGLDPNVPMKDSGIEWVGIIPASWTTTRIKNLLAEKSVKGRPDETVLSLYREYGIIPKDSRDDNHNVTSSDTSSYKFIEVGDFVINKMKAWQGSMALSGYQGIISPAYLVYQFILEDVDPKYLHHLLRSRPYADEFARLSTGIRIGQWDLHSNDFLCTLALLPPLGEQTRIVAYVDDRCSEIDKAIEAKQLIIDELKAYKKSLIWEAVTGKREVV